ncbi:hypothetical protein SNEBB_004809 [Seison nebaliae]|nr:hypothetical protein SNEBB_004809 [Seison nebaliae]
MINWTRPRSKTSATNKIVTNISISNDVITDNFTTSEVDLTSASTTSTASKAILAGTKTNKIKKISDKKGLAIGITLLCAEKPNCFGIYSQSGKVYHLYNINLEIFDKKTDLFLDSEHNFIYDEILKYEKFGSLDSKEIGYIKFAKLTYKHEKTFDEYSTGFGINQNNFFMGNKFLHKMSQLWRLTVNICFTYSFGDGCFEHFDCTFGNKKSGYLAKLGRSKGIGFPLSKSLIGCTQSRLPMHNNSFKVNGKYGFWGTCQVPYVEYIFSMKKYATLMKFRIKFDFPS